MPPPKVKRNQHPVDQYRVLLTIPEPPGVVRVTAEATYGIFNVRDCVPIDRRRSLGGSHPSFQEVLAIPVVALSATEFEVVFYNDAWLREDYYGLGPCEWRGSPSLTLHWANEMAWSYVKASAHVATREEDLDLVHVRMCPVDPVHAFSSCVGEDYANPAVQDYFKIELVTTREGS